MKLKSLHVIVENTESSKENKVIIYEPSVFKVINGDLFVVVDGKSGVDFKEIKKGTINSLTLGNRKSYDDVPTATQIEAVNKELKRQQDAQNQPPAPIVIDGDGNEITPQDTVQTDGGSDAADQGQGEN